MSGISKLKSFTFTLPPFLELTWDLEEREATALRNLTNLFRSRRAFEVHRSMMSEHPIGFIQSISEARIKVRELLDSLPLDATESRLVMLTVINWLSEADDNWFAAMRGVAPRAKLFTDLDFDDMVQVMGKSWPVVQDIRHRVDQLVGVLEKQLSLGGAQGDIVNCHHRMGVAGDCTPARTRAT